MIDTLPKLEKVIRYHEDIIHNRRKKSPNSSINAPNSILYVEGVSKNINDIKVQLPDRR
jgi:hypothetical protein